MSDSDPLLGALREHYGFDSFRPQQRETIEHVRSGGDALVLMPTGGGKSLCYQLPAILSDGLTVVVSPLIALMHDQVTALQQTGATAQYLNSTLSPMEETQIERLVAGGSIKLLYVAPERVNTDRFRDLLERRAPRLIAIDEAHCISEWGHEFRPDYRELRRLTERFVDVPTVACTATATPQVQRDIIEQLDRPRMRIFTTGFMRDNLTLRIVPKRKSTEQLIARLQRLTSGAAIVYTRSRRSAEETAMRLRRSGVTAEHYHGDMTGNQRNAAQDRFLGGETPVICATIAFGMGIDKPDIRLVAHLDMPPSIESYYQEIGRAGRDGEPSECLLFYTKGVWHQQKYFIDQIQDESERQQRISRLRTMMTFCEQSQCRWSRILQYFGERPATISCGHCDNCQGEEGSDSYDERATLIDVNDSRSTLVARHDGPRPLTGEEERLYEALRQERLRLAREEAVSAFVVASNRELVDLVRTRPRTTSELESIKGVGPKKVEKYGEALLQVIADVWGETSSSEGATDPQEPHMTLQMQMPDDADEDQQGEPPEAWQQRFNALGTWRTMTAEREQCDPSELLSFAAMRQVTEHTPDSIDALASIEGVGPIAIERYTEEVALILGIPTAPQAAPTDDLAEGDATRPSWQTTLELYQSGYTLLAIAERRMLSPGTVASHLVTAIRKGVDVDLGPALPSNEHLEAARRELARDPDASASDVHERLDYQLSRAELQLVIATLRPPQVVDD